MSDENRYYIPALAPFYRTLEPFTLPLLRVAAGLMLFGHGYGKLGNVEGGIQFISSLGYPAPALFTYLLIFTEVVLGPLLAIGLFTRFAALASFILMVNAFFFHLPNGMGWTAEGGGWEMPVLWGLVSLVFLARGGGNFSVDSKLSKEL